SAFYWEQRDKPFQVVFRQVEFPWTFLDWRELSYKEQQARLEEYQILNTIMVTALLPTELPVSILFSMGNVAKEMLTVFPSVRFKRNMMLAEL
ncbi:hypothetical protein, partial [Nostoc sp. CHAB 5715]|uniref:hypothetical protein n=1 Tax=Nostoc sp. CHAB 5715 TaxID=2780400 RepID=UPI001E4FBA98